eukprot:GFUD01024772.1.p1 GENE.GFUD01024772.1~~GFUD01024772.1.p1  ORF type:complete len:276 (+),score=72.00 GFUD01024772.1:59-886(+)
MAALVEKIAKCLDPTSGFPTDVTFLFKQEGLLVKEVKAHKLILALASDVFKRGFYGSMKEDEEEKIDIKDARQEVFQVMIEFIYNKQSDWKEYSLSLLSSLYDLGERYDIEEMRRGIIAFIPEYKVTTENVMEVAILAEENILHQPLSDALYEAAALFLKNKFDGKLKNALNFYSEQEATELHALVIFKVMVRMKTIEDQEQKSKCENCKQNPCLNGQTLTYLNFVPGAIIENQLIGKLVSCRNSRNESSGKFTGSFEDGQIVEGLTLNLYVYKC